MFYGLIWQSTPQFRNNSGPVLRGTKFSLGLYLHSTGSVDQHYDELELVVSAPVVHFPEAEQKLQTTRIINVRISDVITLLK